MKPLAIDLFCGLGGWTEGLIAEGYDVVGFDIEQHRYPARALPMSDDGTKIQTAGVDFNNPNVGSSKNRSFNYANECLLRDAPLTGGWVEYPAQLVIQDVLTLHGRQFKDAALIVASLPCQKYSYMAMPWSRAKAIAADYRSGKRDVKQLTALFDACFRIQREACEAAGRHIPLVVENVRGAQKWVGRARWNFGSFYLWGDVPALMPMTFRASKNPGFRFDGSGRSFQSESVDRHTKNTGGSWFNIAHNTTSGKGQNPDGRKTPGAPHKRDGATHTKHLTNPAEHIKVGGEWFGSYAEQKARGTISPGRLHGKGSKKRAFASAMIAKISLPLSRHIARSYLP